MVYISLRYGKNRTETITNGQDQIFMQLFTKSINTQRSVRRNNPVEFIEILD